MGFTSECIAPLVERCLRSFPDPMAGVEWQDDGSNIRFVKYGPRTGTQGLISDVSHLVLRVCQSTDGFSVTSGLSIRSL